MSQERSIAYHQVIAERLQDQPEILEKARRRVQTWLEASDPSQRAAEDKAARESQARRAAEEEVARLRAELERLQGSGG